MRFSMLFLMSSLFCVSAFAQEYYRWVDENGTLHLSDSPPNVSLEINVDIKIIENQNPSARHFLSPDVPDVPSAPSLADAPDTIKNASTLFLSSPKNDDSIRNNQGNIFVKVITNHPLGEDQFIRVLLDGKTIATQQSNSFVLRNVNRGSHTLKVQLMENKKIIHATKKITIFLHRAKLNSPPAKGKT